MGCLAFLALPFRRNRGEGQVTWACSGSAVTGAHWQEHKGSCHLPLSLGSVKCGSGCLSSRPEGLKNGSSLVWPELQFPVTQLTSQWSLYSASPPICQGDTALAGESSHQVGDSLSLTASGPGRLLPKASGSGGILVPNTLQRGARAERSKSFSVYQATCKGQGPKLLGLYLDTL